jgi:hypothetical protein
MANAAHDIIADTTPQLGDLKPSIHEGRFSMEVLRDALQADDATTYTDAELNKMTYNDLVHAVRVGDVTVPAP